jgi:hypothetical protein
VREEDVETLEIERWNEREEGGGQIEELFFFCE